MARILDSNAENYDMAGERIRAGGLVAFATETVYGLGANALDPKAVAAVFELKQRPLYDPLIIHVPNLSAARKLSSRWSLEIQQVAEAFWPGPLTLVVPKADSVPDLVTAGLPNVAIRVPAHPVAVGLLQASGCPIAAPSANRFAGISPTSAQDVAAEFPTQDLWILDGGRCTHGLESTVVSLVDHELHVLRLGSVTLEQLQALDLPLRTSNRSVNQEDVMSGLASPGNLSRHYAPRTPLRWVTPEGAAKACDMSTKIAVLEFGSGSSRISTLSQNDNNTVNLSPTGNCREAAANLYSSLRRLDSMNADVIIAILLPEVGLGRVINDRLRRAGNPVE
jgi:L-threonylcarbamoyladenylate synthase